jgi:predicted Zn-dependent protease
MMTSRNIFFVAVLALTGAALIVTQRRHVFAPASPAAITTLIASGERELTRLPARFTRIKDEEEIRMGEEMVQRVAQLQKSGVVPDYLQEVGARVARGAQRKLPYRFHYLAEPHFINAFALPGGHIVVGQGLLEMMDSEDELAAVLGHEIEHVDLYHCAERLQVEAAMRKIPLGDLWVLPVELFQAGYSKDQELEADRDGTPLAVQAGYSPAGALRFNEKMQSLYESYHEKRGKPSGPLQEVVEGGVGVLIDYFRTHPPPAERVALVKRLIESNHWDATKPERDLRIGWVFWTQRAKRAQDAQRYEVAAAWATRALREESRQPEALGVLGESQLALAQFDAAADAFHRLLEVNPNDLAVIRKYADALGATRQPAHALEEFREWSNGHSTLPQVRVEIAGLSALAGEHVAPESVLGQPSANRGDWERDWVWRLAEWNYRAGRYDDAETLLDYLFPPHLTRQGHVVSNSLAWVLLEKGRLDEALRDFDNNQEGDMGRAIIDWRRLDLDEAMKGFDHATRQIPAWQNPRWVEGFYSSGVAGTIAEIVRAEGNLRRKKKPHEELPEVIALLNQAKELLAGGDTNAAARQTELALWQDPRSVGAWFQHGEIAARVGANARAIADFEKTIDLDPHRYAAYDALDPLLARGGQFSRMIHLWSAYIQLEPGDGRGWLGRARNHARAGDLRLAVEDADESCRHGNAAGCQLRDEVRQKLRI